MAYPDYGSITIRGARENNLKNVSLDIPKRFRVVHDNLNGVEYVTAGRQVPYCLFTDPELARVAPLIQSARFAVLQNAYASQM
jgi:hypothetical protein